MNLFRCIIAFILGSIVSAQGATTPSIACEAPNFDFGTRLNTEDIPHTFIITNKGTAPLIISRIRSGCGCTRHELARSTIPPGESTTLGIRVTIRGHIGPKHASIYLHSNDPADPVYQCHISGIATAEVDMVPRSVNISIPTDITNLESRITIINRTGTPLNPTNLLISNTFCQAQLVTNIPGRDYAVLIKIMTNGISTSTQGSIRIATDHPRYPLLEIPISVTVVRDISAYPPTVVMKEATAQQQAESRYIIVKSSNNQPFTVKQVQALPPVIPVGIQSIKPDWVRLRVGPLTPSASMTGIVIRVHTDHPAQPSVDIPFSVSR
jgi:hypothetical protein